LIFQAVYLHLEGVWAILSGMVSIYYVISGLRRLIQFNINAEAGEVGKFFVGVPTPLGAILLWLVYLGYIYQLLPTVAVMVAMLVIGWLLNSKVKVPHP